MGLWSICSVVAASNSWISRIWTLRFIFFLIFIATSDGLNVPHTLTLHSCFSIKCDSIALKFRMIFLNFRQQALQSTLILITMQQYFPDMKMELAGFDTPAWFILWLEKYMREESMEVENMEDRGLTDISTFGLSFGKFSTSFWNLILGSCWKRILSIEVLAYYP